MREGESPKHDLDRLNEQYGGEKEGNGQFNLDDLNHDFPDEKVKAKEHLARTEQNISKEKACRLDYPEVTDPEVLKRREAYLKEHGISNLKDDAFKYDILGFSPRQLEAALETWHLAQDRYSDNPIVNQRVSELARMCELLLNFEDMEEDKR